MPKKPVLKPRNKRPSARYDIPPSKLENSELCPCFDYPKQDASDQMLDGTKCHRAMETGDWSELDEEQMSAVREANTYVETVRNGFTQIYHELNEFWVHIDGLARGIADKIIVGDIAGEVCVHVLDYKFGRAGITDPVLNLQGLFYGAGVLLHPNYEMVNQVTVHLVTPRQGSHPDPFVLVREAVPAVVKRIQDIIDSYNDPFKQPRECMICDRCAHVHKCPALNPVFAVAARSETGNPVANAITKPERDWTPEDRAVLQFLPKVFEEKFKSIKASNIDFVKAGGEIPLYSMRSRKGNFRVEDIVQALEILGLEPHEVIGDASISFKSLVEAYTRKNNDIDHSDAVALIESSLGPVLTRGADIEYLQVTKKNLTWQELMEGEKHEKLDG